MTRNLVAGLGMFSWSRRGRLRFPNNPTKQRGLLTVSAANALFCLHVVASSIGRTKKASLSKIDPACRVGIVETQEFLKGAAIKHKRP